MATGSNIVHLWSDPKDNIVLPVDTSSPAGAEVIGVGDLIKQTSGEAIVMAAATDDATFVGVAMNANISGGTSKITVCRKGRFRCYMTGIALLPNEAIAYVSGGNGTDYVFEKSAGSPEDTIGWSAGTFTTSSTYIEFDIDTIALGKLITAVA